MKRTAIGESCPRRDLRGRAGGACRRTGRPGRRTGGARTFYATDNQGNLVSFSADNPRKLDSSTPITGLGTGVSPQGHRLPARHR